MEHYKLLTEYHEAHGNCTVPTHYAAQPKLGRWVHTQRHQRRLLQKGKKSSMTQERIDLLDKLLFSWEVRPSLERPRASWQQRFEELKDFHAKNGHFLVTSGSHPHLHAWCYEQKQRLKNLEKNNGQDTSKRMGPERVKLLQEIGFTSETELPTNRNAKEEDEDDEELSEENLDFNMEAAPEEARETQVDTPAEDPPGVSAMEVIHESEEHPPPDHPPTVDAILGDPDSTEI